MKEFETVELILDLDYLKIERIDNIILIETKLKKLGISETTINALKINS